MKNDCVFCAIAAGEIPCFKVYEDDFALAYLDINPFAKGHTLVIPKAHAADIMEIGEADLSELVVRVKRIAAHLKDALGCLDDDDVTFCYSPGGKPTPLVVKSSIQWLAVVMPLRKE